MVTSTILAQGVDFLKFSQKGKGVVLKREWVSLTLTNPFESYDVCVFCSFIPFLLVFFVFHRKDLVSWNLISNQQMYDFYKPVIF